MVLESEVLPFWQWLLYGSDRQLGALPGFLFAFIALALAAMAFGFVMATIRHGPMRAGDLTYQAVATGLKELLFLSPRRVTALARLAVQESIRRSIVVAFVVFLVILSFASWFLGTDNADPARLYLSFVLTATTYLVLLMALFLSTFSLPADIKNKTIHTIVTKPVRAGEIVLGRILGFSAVGTVMLAVMGICSYFFVVRALSHTHQVDVRSLTQIGGVDGPAGRQGRTTSSTFHRHQVTLGEEGAGAAQTAHGHSHRITADGSELAVSPPQDMFRARVPVYGKLRFKDREGEEKAVGINVGNEWTYRSYIEGGTLAEAIWTFNGVSAARYPKGLPIELTVSIFRTHKGDIEKGVLGSLVIRNPDVPDKLASDLTTFRAKEFEINERVIPRKLTDSAGNTVDLFDDLASDGRIEIALQCLDPGQYYGVAQADCYLKARDGSFVANFVKGYLSIWVQMLLMICFGVACSTFLSGPVAMMFTLSIMVLGFFRNFIIGVASGTIQGGGPLESLIRLVTQMNVTLDMEQGLGTTATQTVDRVLLTFMTTFARLLPDFREYGTVGYVSDGFDISLNLLSQNLLAGAGYLLSLFVIGYFFFRTREVAR